MTSRAPIFVVAGVGSGRGTGGASARAFAKAGYRVALIARNHQALEDFASELKSTGADAAAFAIKDYRTAEINSAFDAIRKHWPDDQIRVALWNTSSGVWKPFLEVTDEEFHETVDIGVHGAQAFARQSILSFKDLQLNEVGKRGTLIFTGATASIRGNKTTSSFAASKHALRALSQSLAKEFGPQNIHVAHAIIDGVIQTPRTEPRFPALMQEFKSLKAESIASSYIFLANQDGSAFTWELDLRPAHEKW